MPSDVELSASVFLEYVERDERERMLAALSGVEQSFYLAANGSRLAAIGEKRGEREDRTTAVQYVRFPLDADARELLRSGAGTVAVGVDHPAYRAEAELDAALRASLREDWA
jgi:hypothetical protein